jgi:hypothetical protein
MCWQRTTKANMRFPSRFFSEMIAGGTFRRGKSLMFLSRDGALIMIPNKRPRLSPSDQSTWHSKSSRQLPGPSVDPIGQLSRGPHHPQVLGREQRLSVGFLQSIHCRQPRR